MKKLKIMWNILKMTSVDKLIYILGIYIIFTSIVLQFIEPNFRSFGEGIWYCFVTFSTVGFGDIVPVTIVGKILSVGLMLYGMIVVAFITGTLVNFYQEILKVKQKDNILAFIDKLERLPELSKEELTELSNTVKEKRYKI